MLKKKMLRDIKQNLSQFITIFLMVFIGVMAYSGIESYMNGMKQTADNFYKDYNLQALFLKMELIIPKRFSFYSFPFKLDTISILFIFLASNLETT